jgi:hypothetical protein
MTNRIILFTLILFTGIYFFLKKMSPQKTRVQPSIIYSKVEYTRYAHLSLRKMSGYDEINNKIYEESGHYVDSCFFNLASDTMEFYFEITRRPSDTLAFKVYGDKLVEIIEGYTGKRGAGYVNEMFTIDEVREFKLNIDTSNIDNDTLGIYLEARFDKAIYYYDGYQKAIRETYDSIVGCVYCHSN